MMNKKNRAVGGAPIVESRKKSLGIYVHIPFCRSKCEYCDFYSIPGARSKELMTRYLDAVIAHIRESAPCAVGYEVDTVYFGGGTPSFFGATGLSRIFAEIDRRFDVSRDAEVTLEANPDSVTLPMLTPSLFFNLVNGIIGSLQAFNSAYLVTNGGPMNATLFYGLYQYQQAFQFGNMGYASAMAWFWMLIIVLLTALVFKSSSAWVFYQDDRA